MLVASFSFLEKNCVIRRHSTKFEKVSGNDRCSNSGHWCDVCVTEEIGQCEEPGDRDQNWLLLLDWFAFFGANDAMLLRLHFCRARFVFMERSVYFLPGCTAMKERNSEKFLQSFWCQDLLRVLSRNAVIRSLACRSEFIFLFDQKPDICARASLLRTSFCWLFSDKTEKFLQEKRNASESCVAPDKRKRRKTSLSKSPSVLRNGVRKSRRKDFAGSGDPSITASP